MAGTTYTATNLLAGTGCTGTGLHVAQTSPELITPNIGSATGASLSILGTITSGAAAGGSTGNITAYPTTTGSGFLQLLPAVNGTGNFGTTISNQVLQAQNQNVTIPDVGAATARFIMSEGTGQTIGADLTINTVRVGLGGGSIASNIVVGIGSFANVNSGSNAIAIGNGTMIAAYSGIGSIAIGGSTGAAMVSCNQNVLIGYITANSLSTGDNNTCIGSRAGSNVPAGSASLTSGSNNTLLGFNASVNTNSTVGAIAIGSNAVADIATGATSGDNGPGIAIGSASQIVGFRGDGSIYPSTTGAGFWRPKINGTNYMVPLFTDGATAWPAITTSQITFSSTSGIIGTTTNDNAAAGSVGEYIESVITSGAPVSLTSSAAANITSISLTAGDWDVWGSLVMAWAVGTTSVNRQGGINTVSVTLPTGPYITKTNNPTTTGTGDEGYPVPSRRISLSATTTVYLVAFSVFSVSTMDAYGFIAARRAR